MTAPVQVRTRLVPPEYVMKDRQCPEGHQPALIPMIAAENNFLLILDETHEEFKYHSIALVTGRKLKEVLTLYVPL